MRQPPRCRFRRFPRPLQQCAPRNPFQQKHLYVRTQKKGGIEKMSQNRARYRRLPTLITSHACAQCLGQVIGLVMMCHPSYTASLYPPSPLPTTVHDEKTTTTTQKNKGRSDKANKMQKNKSRSDKANKMQIAIGDTHPNLARSTAFHGH